MEDSEIQYVRNIARKLSNIDAEELTALALINLGRLVEGHLEEAGKISETLKDISECLIDIRNDIRDMNRPED